MGAGVVFRATPTLNRFGNINWIFPIALSAGYATQGDQSGFYSSLMVGFGLDSRPAANVDGENEEIATVHVGETHQASGHGFSIEFEPTFSFSGDTWSISHLSHEGVLPRDANYVVEVEQTSPHGTMRAYRTEPRNIETVASQNIRIDRLEANRALTDNFKDPEVLLTHPATVRVIIRQGETPIAIFEDSRVQLIDPTPLR